MTHVARAADMDARMAIGGGSTHHGDCHDYSSGNDDVPLCDDACQSTSLVPAIPALAEPSECRPVFLIAAVCDPAGHTDPPDPYPPRIITLS